MIVMGLTVKLAVVKLASKAKQYVVDVLRNLQEDEVFNATIGLIIALLGVATWNSSITAFGLGMIFTAVMMSRGKKRKRK